MWLAKTSGSRVGFFSKGLITTNLNNRGTYPVDTDRFIIYSIEVLTRGKASLSDLVGLGLRRQINGLDEEIVDDK